MTARLLDSLAPRERGEGARRAGEGSPRSPNDWPPLTRRASRADLSPSRGRGRLEMVVSLISKRNRNQSNLTLTIFDTPGSSCVTP
jgi:hypothetical protein